MVFVSPANRVVTKARTAQRNRFTARPFLIQIGHWVRILAAAFSAMSMTLHQGEFKTFPGDPAKLDAAIREGAAD
jgi:hypothetical protein